MSNYFISTRFVLRKNKAKDGYAPIRLVYTIHGQRAELSTKLKCQQNHWDQRGQKVTGHSIKAKALNTQLDRFKFEFLEIIDRLKSNTDLLTIDDVKNHLKGDCQKEETLLGIFDLFLNQKKALVGKSYSISTVKKYTYLKDKVVAFIKTEKNSEDLKLSELSKGFAYQFENFLKGVQKIGHNSTTKYLQCLKSVINNAVELELIDKNPISSYRCSYEKTEIEVLSQHDIDKLVSKNFENKRLEEVKNVFLFCCYTGYAYVDVSKLTPDNLIKGINGKLWIQTTRTKSKVDANVPLLPPAVAILEKYKEHPHCINQGVLLPVKSNQKMNEYLKEIANICNIKVRLTTHVARHTFATTILINNGVAIETVSKLLGHSKLSTTQIYAKLRDKKVANDMEVLSEKLFKANSSMDKQKVV